MKRSEVLELAKEVWGDTSGKPWSDSAIGHLQMFATLVEEQTINRQKAKHREQQLMDGQASLLKGSAKKESTLQEISDIGQQAHTDHPMRHWDRTCPACATEIWDTSDMAHRPGGLTVEQEFVPASNQPLIDEIKRLRDLNRQLMGESA
jgi:hypothetical protein